MNPDKNKINNDTKNKENEKEDVFEQEFLSTPQLVWRIIKKHKLGVISMWVLAILYFFAIFADFFSPMDPYKNHIEYRFMHSTKMHSTNLITGEKTKRYVNLYTLERDPVTRKGTFVEATHFDKLKAINSDNGKEETYQLGKYSETFNSTITEMYFNYYIVNKAVTKDGQEILLDKKSVNDQILLPISLFEKDKQATAPVRDKDGFLKPNFSNFLTGNEVLYKEDKRDIAIDEAKSNWKYGSKIKDKDIVKINKYFKLDYIYVGTDNFDEVDIYPADIQGVTFKRYDVKFFIKSWDYKLLGFIPTNVHFIGVEKTKLPSLKDYISNDGIFYLWGADKFGRDMLSRLLYGSRVSLSIGFVGILITFTIGLFFGGAAGYYGGWVDEGLMRFTEILMSLPSFYLLIALGALLPGDLSPALRYMLIIVILSFISWPGMARVIRGMTLGMKSSEFIEAAVALGYPGRRIIWKHMIPNTMTYIIVSATMAIPSYIIGEASLSFLGLGITEPSSSWGLMLSQAQSLEALTNYPWLLIPGLLIFITALSFNLFGDALRDALDPRALGH
ncbi:peptide ABC transporter permease [Tepiditoga spiralis]|uniref:Peptide ABC transporter permease n=1 Tax=Tepiditoga spiralis TaxID=2108365 RepID=A0A7G1GBV5_9BACT|nr:ABC transporter permease [Tepiditoga spiralis]BBE32012.1 peptide ABC transporter permease [Tepiditoga spiralis]